MTTNVKEDARLDYAWTESIRGRVCHGPVDHGDSRYLLIGRRLHPLHSMVPLSISVSDSILSAVNDDPQATAASLRTLDSLAASYRGPEQAPGDVGSDAGQWKATEFVAPPASDTQPLPPVEPLPAVETNSTQMFDLPDRAQTPVRVIGADDDPMPDLPGWFGGVTGQLGKRERTIAEGW